MEHAQFSRGRSYPASRAANSISTSPSAHYLGARTADKKLMLILTDGRPSDVDTHDERLLIEDTRQAVKELDQQGIFSYCISLDPKADVYVGDIFGRQFTFIDNIERLPERLPQLFMALSK
jgi:nitric oxide reductase activation protein